jgi:hypothetical protein
MKRVGTVFTVLLIVAAPAVFGGDSGTASGRFATHTMSTDATDLPDGGRVEIAHYYQATFSDQEGFPLDNTSSDCVGMYVFSKTGAVASASGTCFGTDADGNMISLWWRHEQGGTASCPNMCGSWGYFDGTGKLKGISGGGTFNQTTLFPEGSTGTWKGSYSIP